MLSRFANIDKPESELEDYDSLESPKNTNTSMRQTKNLFKS